MNDGWLRYERPILSRGIPSRPHIATIQKSGVIRISHLRWTEMGCPEHVQLFWDDGRKAIGLLPAAKTGATYKVARTGRANSRGVAYSLSCRSFLRQYNLLGALYAKKYPCHVEESELGRILVIETAIEDNP